MVHFAGKRTCCHGEIPRRTGWQGLRGILVCGQSCILESGISFTELKSHIYVQCSLNDTFDHILWTWTVFPAVVELQYINVLYIRAFNMIL